MRGGGGGGCEHVRAFMMMAPRETMSACSSASIDSLAETSNGVTGSLQKAICRCVVAFT